MSTWLVGDKKGNYKIEERSDPSGCEYTFFYMFLNFCVAFFSYDLQKDNGPFPRWLGYIGLVGGALGVLSPFLVRLFGKISYRLESFFELFLGFWIIWLLLFIVCFFS